MSRPLQIMVADQRGLNVGALLQAIESEYRTPEGKTVRARIAQGLHVDGVPMGYVRITDREPA